MNYVKFVIIETGSCFLKVILVGWVVAKLDLQLTKDLSILVTFLLDFVKVDNNN